MNFFAPANISCIFSIALGKTPDITGSYGIGFTLTEGVRVSIQKAKETSIMFNNTLIDLPTVLFLIKKLSPVPLLITISSNFPLGCGFGISGASALATAYAINAMFHLKKTDLELARIAHSAEVSNNTGLGDITNQYFGGCLLKVKPSYLFDAIKISLDQTELYYKIFSELSTKSVLTRDMRKINNAGKKALVTVEESLFSNKLKLQELLSISKEFAIESGLLRDAKVVQAITSIEFQEGHATMIMLGNAVISDIPFEGARKITIGPKLH